MLIVSISSLSFAGGYQNSGPGKIKNIFLELEQAMGVAHMEEVLMRTEFLIKIYFLTTINTSLTIYQK